MLTVTGRSKNQEQNSEPRVTADMIDRKPLEFNSRCVCSFPIVIKHHDQGNLQKKEFIWGLSSRGVRLSPS